jgi:lipid-A-disaccharide synthase
MADRLGIVAGAGDLPRRIIEACRAAGRPVYVLALEGAADPSLVTDTPHGWVRLGAAGRARKLLRENGVREVVMAGGVSRPPLWSLRPDWLAARFLAKVAYDGVGDDGLLRAVIRELESYGFRVIGASDVLGEALAPEGPLGLLHPDDAARADIEIGLRAARDLGACDIGQAAVVQQGVVLGVEGRDGTDALIARCGGLRRPGAGPILVKVAKPGQEKRADLPTIGPATIAAAKAAGFRGIAVEAGATLVIDRPLVAEAADAGGMFVAGIAGQGDQPPLIYIVTGEPSGDALGARLMVALRERTGGAVRFAGIGGEQMAAQGLTSRAPLADLAIIGVAEVLPRARRIFRHVANTVADIRRQRPAAVVTIDSSAFTWRIAQRLRRRGETLPLIHCVAPMVWAWRGGRARRMARWYDLLLTLLPFEPPYFERVGLACRYVGHPIVESGADRGDGSGFRRRHGIDPAAPLLTVLPGSRGGEVARLLPIFAGAVALLAQRRPGLRVVVPTTETVAEMVGAAVAQWPVPTLVLRGQAEKYDAFAASNAALAASGTVSLELAMAGLAAVIAYRVTPATAFVLRRLVKVRYANLVNVLLDREAVPELLQENCTPKRLADAVGRLLDDPKACAEQRLAADAALRLLGYGGVSPGLRAADEILALIAARR